MFGQRHKVVFRVSSKERSQGQNRVEETSNKLGIDLGGSEADMLRR